MQLHNVGKLVVLTLIALTTLVGLMLERIDPTPGWATIGSIVGYLVGNGVAAYRREPVAPAFRSRQAPELAGE